jgi:small-conductance mechanosensitive channel
MERSDFSMLKAIWSRLRKPLFIFIPLLIIDFSIPLLGLEPRSFYRLNKLVDILLVLSFAYVLVGFANAGRDYVLHKYDLTKKDNLRERKIRTQLQFLRKLLLTLIWFLAVCAILLSFESLRKLGTGLLTGVGLGGIIIGFAAQRSLSNLLAGFQIAFTQPLRIDDVLVVEGEWGRVEEITLTYVVLNIWDQRRLILPINYFIEKPFQNWTRSTSEMLGTVFIYLDYNLPIEAIRAEYMRLLGQTELWDKRVGIIQITDITKTEIEVRCLMSAASSGIAFDLRCYIRENLILFIQKNYPEALPRTRMELRGKASV